MYVPLQIAGGDYRHKSRSLSAQTTRNFLPQIHPAGAENQFTLDTFPGLAMFSEGSGMDRGMLEHRNVVYKVTGTTLESIDSAGTRTTLGNIPGVERCILAGFGEHVLIVSAGAVYLWDGSTLTQGSDPDFETPNSVAVLNNQAIYDGDGGRFGVSDVGDALAINGLNYATAESDADELVRVYSFGQNLFLFGEKTIEQWWNSGEGSPPFDRIEGGIFQIGLAAIHSVAATKRVMYFLGSDRNVYRVASSGFENNFTPQPILREFQRYSVVSDAIGMMIPYQGTNLYVLKFPTENKTWCYLEGGDWIELSSFVYDVLSTSGRWKGNSYAYAFSKHLVADEDGNILQLDDETYTDNEDLIKRVRVMSPLHGGALGAPGKHIELGEVRMTAEMGQGDGTIMLSVSTDGGKTWSSEMWATLGQTGDYLKELVWSGINAVGMSVIIKISTSDACYFSIHSMGAEVRLGI
jgi:hypothetical protein